MSVRRPCLSVVLTSSSAWPVLEPGQRLFQTWLVFGVRRHEALSVIRPGRTVPGRVLPAAGDDLPIGLLEPSAERRRNRQAGLGLRDDAAIYLSVRLPAGADDGGGRRHSVP